MYVVLYVCVSFLHIVHVCPRSLLLSVKTHLILIEEHLELFDRDSEVSLVELIGNVPAESTKLASLLNQGMEETEAKQQLLPLFLQVRNEVCLK